MSFCLSRSINTVVSVTSLIKWSLICFSLNNNSLYDTLRSLANKHFPKKAFGKFDHLLPEICSVQLFFILDALLSEIAIVNFEQGMFDRLCFFLFDILIQFSFLLL